MSMKIEDKGPVSIVGISGSLRKASFSTEILRLIAKESAPAIHVHLVTLEEIPPYNEDLDTATIVEVCSGISTATTLSWPRACPPKATSIPATVRYL